MSQLVAFLSCNTHLDVNGSTVFRLTA